MLAASYSCTDADCLQKEPGDISVFATDNAGKMTDIGCMGFVNESFAAILWKYGGGLVMVPTSAIAFTPKAAREIAGDWANATPGAGQDEVNALAKRLTRQNDNGVRIQ